ncbi:MAG: hypothetical protein U0324_44730 [Polyangiales bacterium]
MERGERGGRPSARAFAVGAWTGTELVVWGGIGDDGSRGDGAAYDPAADRWRTLPSAGAPGRRANAVGVWTGAEMVVFGGFGDDGFRGDGARFDPAAGRWRALPSVGAPSPRARAVGVWTGREVFVWGGFDDLGVLPADGARYDPAGDRWRPVDRAGAPTPRSDTAGVWTGAEVLFWGGAGVDQPGPFPTPVPAMGGGRYRPDVDRWMPLDDLGAPSPRFDHGAVWTGEELVVWGGAGALGTLVSGARFAPGR